MSCPGPQVVLVARCVLAKQFICGLNYWCSQIVITYGPIFSYDIIPKIYFHNFTASQMIIIYRSLDNNIKIKGYGYKYTLSFHFQSLAPYQSKGFSFLKVQNNINSVCWFQINQKRQQN